MNITDRFKNQRISQLIHLKNRSDGDFPRVCNCFRLKSHRSFQVSLRKKDGARRAHYGDLQTCGSVWSCPVCSSIISEGRTEILQQAINNWRSMSLDNCVIMITLTTPHYIFESLADVLAVQDNAVRIMTKQPIKKGGYKRYSQILKDIGSVGSFTGREITFGQNGWHPHRHILIFCKRQPLSSLRRLRHDIVIAWSLAFLRAGGEIRNMDHFQQRAVSVDQITDDDGFTRISRYVTTVEGETWTLAKEATKGISKLAKNGNITPFGMLQAIRSGDPLANLYSKKFHEYATTMKGKKQFFGSPGLSQKLNIIDVSDGDILAEKQTGDHYLFLKDPDWEIILDNDLRGEIVEMTEDKNEFEFIDILDNFLSDFKKRSA